MEVRILFKDGSTLDTIVSYIRLCYEDDVPILIIYGTGETRFAVQFDSIIKIKFI